MKVTSWQVKLSKCPYHCLIQFVSHTASCSTDQQHQICLNISFNGYNLAIEILLDGLKMDAEDKKRVKSTMEEQTVDSCIEAIKEIFDLEEEAEKSDAESEEGSRSIFSMH